MHMFKITSLCFIFVTTLAFSQGMRGGNIQFDLDMACFSGSEGFSYLEIYFSMARDAVTHVDVENGSLARFQTVINMFRGDSLLNSKVDAHSDLLADSARIGLQEKLHSIFPFYLKPNDYRIRFQVTDLESRQTGSLERKLFVPDFRPDSLMSSSIQLATEIRPNSEQNPFVKNGYEIITNASSMYGIELPILFYYTEIYGLSPLEPGLDSSYTAVVLIRDHGGNEVKRNPARSKKRLGGSLVELGKMNVAGLRSGNYTLELRIRDHATNDTLATTKSFIVYRRADYVSSGSTSGESSSDLMSEFEAMPEDVLDQQLAYCEYLASKNEKKMVKKLDLAGKREFLKNFWRQRDENPVTAANETKMIYFERINQCNQRFGNRSQEGWKSDQGRIFILYGEPDEIERRHTDLNQRYYEYWHYYHIEGGVQFIFVDMQDYGEIRLVHSSHSKEIHDYEWQRWLRQ